MQTQINVKCTDQNLKLSLAPAIASGGVNENVITFEFCSLWNDFKKVAVFWREEWLEDAEKKPLPIALDENNSCVVPWEVTADAGVFFFGVLGVLGEVERTSNVLEYDVSQGVIRGEYAMPEATKDLFAQLVEASHTHENKDVLDTITQEMLDAIGKGGTGLTEEQAANLAANTEARHTHGNKELLDEMTKGKNGNLNVKVGNANAIHWCAHDGSVIEKVETDETTGDITIFNRLVPNTAIPAEKVKIKQHYKISELENDKNFVTAEYVTAAINGSLDEIEAMIDESGVLDE